jgi:hypothetical protein
VSRIALVSPTRSNQIESILLRMLQAGQLRGRVSEQQLIDLLEQVCVVALSWRQLNAALNSEIQADDAQKKASGQGTIVVCASRL